MMKKYVVKGVKEIFKQNRDTFLWPKSARDAKSLAGVKKLQHF